MIELAVAELPDAVIEKYGIDPFNERVAPGMLYLS